MTDQKDYRLFLESRFEGLTTLMNAHFHDTHGRLDKLNGKVLCNENNVKAINEDLTEYRMIKKYPKIAVTIIAIAVIAVILSFRSIIHNQNILQSTQDDFKTQIDMINTPIKDTRSGKTYLYPSGLLIDSIISHD